MESSQIAGATPERLTLHMPSLLQGVLSAIAFLFLAGGALVAAFMGMMSAVLQDQTIGDPLSLFLMSALLFGSGMLMLPSVYYGLFRAVGRPTFDMLPWLCRLRPSLWIFAFPLVLLIGYGVYQLPILSWIVLPPLHLLGVGIPVGWMLFLAVRDLPLGSAQRFWGVFGSGLVLAPALITVFELLAAFVFLLIASIYVASQPELLNKILSLAQTLPETPPSPEALLDELGPFLIRPAVLFGALSFGAVLVPLIEELIKPIGVWLLASRRLRPAAGFAAGALSGAGYALFESLALTSSGQAWPALMVARIGTASVHILTTAITGWALVQAWTRRRYLLLGLSYLTAVTLHGLWNGLTIFSAFAVLAEVQNLPLEIPGTNEMAIVAPSALLFLGMASLVALIWFNRRLAATLGVSGTGLRGGATAESGQQSVL